MNVSFVFTRCFHQNYYFVYIVIKERYVTKRERFLGYFYIGVFLWCDCFKMCDVHTFYYSDWKLVMVYRAFSSTVSFFLFSSKVSNFSRVIRKYKSLLLLFHFKINLIWISRKGLFLRHHTIDSLQERPKSNISEEKWFYLTVQSLHYTIWT